VMGHEQKPFEETHPHLKDFNAFLDVLSKESERGAALISATMIDDLLGKCIRSFLIDHKDVEQLLEGFNAPLGSFSARIVAAFSLGLLSGSEYSDCQNIRKVRNAFAHDVRASFKDQRLTDVCANLRLCAQDYGDVRVDARGRYTTAAVAVILNLTNRPHYADERRLRYTGWPY
jgi:mannitol operon repressor